jgi:hypothetical protein
MFEIAHRPRLFRAIAAPLTLGAIVASTAVGGGAGCSRAEGQANLDEFSAFKDVDSAPAAIKTAAAAVFRIRTAYAYGTGSFLSADGLILTNNHVAGIDVCALEGCYASLALDHQRHSPVSDPVDVFLEPQHVSIGLDMAVLQAYSLDAAGKKLAKVASPSYLTFEPRQAAELAGSKVFVVGHPEGHLKKWTTGEVADADGVWFRASAFSLPGNSGSPILNEAGHIVGLLHRGPTGEDLVTKDGINVYSIGTTSAALVGAMSDPLPAAMHAVTADTTEADVVKNQLVYLNARTSAAKVAGVDVPILPLLATACDAALADESYASPDDLQALESPCFDSESWIECETDASPAPFTTCPDDPARAAWSARYTKVFDRHRALNGSLLLSEITFAQAALQSSKASGIAAGTGLLQAFLDQQQPPLTFAIAPYLAAFGIDSYGGTTLLAYVTHFDHAPEYGLSLGDIVNTALWLNAGQQMTATQVYDVLDRLNGDANLTLGAKLRIEEVEYQSKKVD